MGVVGVFNGEAALSALVISEAPPCCVLDGEGARSGVEIETGDSTKTDGVVWILVGRDSVDPASVLRATGGREARNGGGGCVVVPGGAILVYTTWHEHRHPTQLALGF